VVRVALWMDVESELLCARARLPTGAQLEATGTTFEILAAAIEDQLLSLLRPTGQLEVEYVAMSPLALGSSARRTRR
jgi:hypothetical protein